MWTKVRAEIEKIRQERKIPEEYFHSVNINKWRNIEEKIFSSFCKISDPALRGTKISSCLKGEKFVVPEYLKENFSLEKIIPSDELLYFLVEDHEEGERKYWFYEGKISAIQTLIDEAEFWENIIFLRKNLTGSSAFLTEKLFSPEKKLFCD